MNKKYIILAIVCCIWALIGREAKCNDEKFGWLSLRLAYEKDSPDATKMRMKLSGEELYVSNQALLDSRQIASASVQQGIGRPVLIMTLTPEGRKVLSSASSSHIGALLAILVDGELVSAPMIQARLDQNEVILNTERLDESALRAFAARINSSAKP